MLGDRRRVRDALSFRLWRAWRWWRVVSEGWGPLQDPRAVRAAGVRRALVVRLDAIGDFVVWTGAARALREWLGPNTHVTLAANAVWADVARTQGVADEVWVVDRGALEWDGAYRSALRRRVAAAGFDLAINPRWTREMMLADSVMRWSRAPQRIGLVGDDVLFSPRDRRRADAWYTTLHPSSRMHMHELERHVEFLRALGASVGGVPAPKVDVAALPGGHEFPGLERYFVVSPGASALPHRWPAPAFAELARAVQALTGWRAVVVGDAGERNIAAVVAEAVPGALNLAGETSVPALIRLIHGARLVLTNDTAAVHLAAATGVRAVCIAGGWHWHRFVPYPASIGALADRVHTVSLADEMPCFGCRGYCSLPHRAGEARPCVDRVSIERALAMVNHVLSLPDMQSDG